ncbi:lmo0937 family membrane protein [Metapseudomonas resinovorans]|nr:lmo0937 family membrane protein [Pseudomonas resinovorans]
MFEVVVIGLLVLWAVGLLTSFYMGGLIHILLLLSIALVIVRSRLRQRE